MINPWIGYLNHKLCWYEESHEREMKDGEKDGLWKAEVIRLLQEAGFEYRTDVPFLYHLNRLFIAFRPAATSPRWQTPLR
jgi:hypothetical protein